jgi:CO/xanthine dehydrogenase Mo-binding subunit
VILMDETDPMSSPMKAKGISELGICGVAAVAQLASGRGIIRLRWTS